MSHVVTDAGSGPDRRSLTDWLAWLETLSPREIELGLGRVRTVLSRMALPRWRRVVHVAGTNGKGSVVAMLEGLYLGAGRRVGCYTSPHVLRFNERMRVDGCELDDAAIIAGLQAVEAARDGVVLTYFEFGTLAALAAFAAAGADTLVLEVGLGGRLDAVNAIEPDAAVITNVALDHCDWLGPDIESIAREKAGIMRGGIPVVFGSGDVPRAIVAQAARRGADLRLPGRDFDYRLTKDGWSWRGREVELDGLPPPALGAGIQIANAAAALALAEALEGTALLAAARVHAMLTGLALPGRMQRVTGRRRWLLDVAHNPAAAEVLAATLASESRAGRLLIVTGILADKDVEGIVQPLCARADLWIAVPAASPRALSSRNLALRIAGVCRRPCRVAPGLRAGLGMAEALAGDADLLVVTGSFYTVGPALAWLQASVRT